MPKETKSNALPGELRRAINQVAHLKSQLRYMRYRRELEEQVLAMLADGMTPDRVRFTLLDGAEEAVR